MNRVGSDIGGGGMRTSWMCTICEKVYVAKVQMEDHIRGAHLGQGSVFSCKFCQKTFQSRNSRSGHVSKHHKLLLDQYWQVKKIVTAFISYLVIKSQSCWFYGTNQQFLDSKKYEFYFLILFPLISVCMYCLMSFNKPSSLRSHISRRHKDEHKNMAVLACKICRKFFPTITELKTHFSTHKDFTPIEPRQAVMNIM